MAETTCKQCVERTHKIYYGEMSEKEMEISGTTFWKCYKCGYAPLIWNTLIGDSSCESCGRWQKGKQK